MARQILRQKYEQELKPTESRIQAKREDQADLIKSNKHLGIKRLGQVLTHRMWKRDMSESNRYRKIEKQTLMKLMSKMDKTRVKSVIQSLRDYNRKVLEENNIREVLDDNIMINISFAKNIEILNENTKIGAIGGQTPVQLQIPYGLYGMKKSQILLLVRDSETRQINQIIDESTELENVNMKVTSPVDFLTESKNKNEIKKALNDFDLILIDSRVSVQKAAKELGVGMNILMRKKLFPFPVKIHGANYTAKKIADNIKEACEGCTHALIGGGKEFSFKIAKTESLDVKESVKNVIQGLFKCVCIILYAQEKKTVLHNQICQVSLQSSKSIPLPIFDRETENQEEI